MTVVKMAHTIWTVPINKDVCTVLAMVEHSLVNPPKDLWHQPLLVILSMRQVNNVRVVLPPFFELLSTFW